MDDGMIGYGIGVALDMLSLRVIGMKLQ